VWLYPLVRAGERFSNRGGQLLPPDLAETGLLDRIHGEDHRRVTNETPRPLLLQKVGRAMPDVARQEYAIAGIRMGALSCFALLIAVSSLDRTVQQPGIMEYVWVSSSQ
jgi:hypothetical protein